MDNAPVLLTPGPLTTSEKTKQAMMRDWGSWDTDFHAIGRTIWTTLEAMVSDDEQYGCVPLPGSGTHAVEATITSLVPRTGKILIPSNGSYCERIAKICQATKRPFTLLSMPEDQPMSVEAIEQALISDPNITHLALVHCETSSGVLNPLKQISDCASRHECALIIDAMSTFGAIPIHDKEIKFDALISSANKCLEGVPGLAFSLIRKDILEIDKNYAESLSFNLHDQYQYLNKTNQFRFTPPTHVIAAFHAALEQYQEEGGLTARLSRYTSNRNILVDTLADVGTFPLLQRTHLSPIIVSFHVPKIAGFNFQTFYQTLKKQGYIIYPGKLTIAETFRVGCIGAIDESVMSAAAKSIAQLCSTASLKHERASLSGSGRKDTAVI